MTLSPSAIPNPLPVTPRTPRGARGHENGWGNFVLKLIAYHTDLIRKLTGRLQLCYPGGEGQDQVPPHIHQSGYHQESHRAVEARERLEAVSENQTLISITYQNYFRKYAKLAGMTGTAATEARELSRVYGLEVVSIPTHRPLRQVEHRGRAYATLEEKLGAIVEGICHWHALGRPVLVGTISVAHDAPLPEVYAEAYGSALAEAEQRRRCGLLDPAISLEHYAAALAALRPQLEAERQKVLQLGGLHVIGSEPHESRRIDDQLRGRADRQGDPGSSRFYLSLEDELMRLFLPGWVCAGLRWALCMPGRALGQAFVLLGARVAQRRAERHYCKIRRALLQRSEAIRKWRQSTAYDEVRDRWREQMV